MTVTRPETPVGLGDLTLPDPRAARLGTAPYTLFPVRVRQVRRLSPTFLRITFTGDDLDLFADLGDDRRIKLVLPAPGDARPALPEGIDWYSAWRALPSEHRPPVRTYTVRAARPHLREVDVDVVVHDHGGPASRWARRAAPGDDVFLVGPNALCPGPIGGAEWRPPAGAPFLLLGGDETALPAIAAILERLPDDARGVAVIEVPHAADVLDLRAPAGVRVDWRPREGRPHGQALDAEVRAVAAAALTGAVPAPRPAGAPDIPHETVFDDDADLLWDVPADAPTTGLYAWLAGEAGVIAGLRRHLVRELGVDRRSVAFMGYWRAGVAETV